MDEMNPVDIIARMPKGLKNTHLTFVTIQNGVHSRSTFASDNAENLEPWWSVQCAKLFGRDDLFICLTRRDFLPERDPETGLPMKALSMCAFEGNSIRPISAEEARHAFSTDADTGKPIQPPDATVYVDFEI